MLSIYCFRISNQCFKMLAPTFHVKSAHEILRRGSHRITGMLNCSQEKSVLCLKAKEVAHYYKQTNACKLSIIF